MSGAQQAIFPGIIGGSLVVVLVSFLIASPNTAEAFTAANQSAAAAPVKAAAVEHHEAATGAGCAISQSYPQSVQQWCETISRYAQAQSLDANLVAAVILQESGGNSDAYSHSGAVGLMQVMPRDGLAAGFMCINGPCFSGRPSMAELYDPDFNIAYGTRMLAGLMQKYGSERDALAAYGPKDVGYYYADKVLAIYNQYQ